MSDLLVERNGELVGRGLESLGEILSLPEGDTGNETDEMALELLEVLRGEKPQPHPDGPLAALQEEMARAAARRTEAQSLVRELLEIGELQQSAEAELREAAANLAEATGLLKEMVVQAEVLLSYGVQRETIYAVKRQIEETKESHQVTCAPIRDRLTELSQRIEEIERLPYVRPISKRRRKKKRWPNKGPKPRPSANDYVPSWPKQKER